MAIKRVPTGIEDVDRMIEGGFPEGASILVKGAPGTLKTIFGLQYLYNGAKNYGDKGAYVTFSQPVESIKEQALLFGWDFDKLPVEFIDLDITRESDLEASIANRVKAAGAKRIVVDSLTSFLAKLPIAKEEFISDQIYEALKKVGPISISEDMLLRALTFRFLRRMRESDGTAIYIFEERLMESAKETCEYLVDGVIKLAKIEALGKRTLIIEKMRLTKHDFLGKPILITNKGIVLEKSG